MSLSTSHRKDSFGDLDEGKIDDQRKRKNGEEKNVERERERKEEKNVTLTSP